MTKTILFTLAAISISSLAQAQNRCVVAHRESTDPIIAAIRASRGEILGAYHIQYGAGYIFINERTGKVIFDQNSHARTRVENVPYSDIALELPPSTALDKAEIQKDIRFAIGNEIYRTYAKTLDGDILAENVMTLKKMKISVKELKKLILEEGPKTIIPGDVVVLDIDFNRTPFKAQTSTVSNALIGIASKRSPLEAKVLAVNDIYAEVLYETARGRGLNSSASGEFHPVRQLIALNELYVLDRDPIRAALVAKGGQAIVAYHSKYGVGYLTMNLQTGQMDFEPIHRDGPCSNDCGRDFLNRKKVLNVSLQELTI
jgi:hypothetical protein